ncbi:MAG TPA: CPBP family glutamic-type intramembrane protease, partial [bacterium]|nr:CPBP family glutamic-type intramembrane protease [bacterium]
VELFLSWLLLRLFGYRKLEVLGFYPTRNRLLQFLSGLILAVFLVCLLQYILSVPVHNPWQVNPRYTLHDLGSLALFLFKSVVFENLIFFGAPLYILIDKIGIPRAVGFASVAFGIYHWFSWGVLGQPWPMLIDFVILGGLGLAFALGFAWTKAAYLPFALHFGVDMATMSFGKGPALFIHTFAQDPHTPQGVMSIVYVTIFYAWFPLTWLAYIALAWYWRGAAFFPILRSKNSSK